MKRGYDKAAKERGSTRYQRARRIFLFRHPTCAICAEQGIVRAATQLDHKIPVHKAPELFWDRDNWQGLCEECHRDKSARELRTKSGTPKSALEWDDWVEGKRYE